MVVDFLSLTADLLYDGFDGLIFFLGFGDNILGKRGCRGLFVPFDGGEVVSDELLVVTCGAASLSVGSLIPVA